MPGSLSLGLQAHAAGHLDTGPMAGMLLTELSPQPLMVALLCFCFLNICSIAINCNVLIL